MKFYILIIATTFMVACGNKTKGAETLADTKHVDSTMLSDGATFDSPKLLSVEAVEKRIRVCFQEVNKMAVDNPIDIRSLDKQFCSKDFLEIEDKLYKKVRENRAMFDGDDGHHWLAGIASPSKIDSIKAELLSGNQAHADVWLSDEYGRKGYLKIILNLENGTWKLHNWIDEEVFLKGSLFDWMQSVVDDSEMKDGGS